MAAFAYSLGSGLTLVRRAFVVAVCLLVIVPFLSAGPARGQPAGAEPGLPPIGIGRNCVIDRAIIDKNARIADGVVITPEGKPADLDAGNYFIRDGIVVVPKNAVIPAGFWI